MQSKFSFSLLANRIIIGDLGLGWVGLNFYHISFFFFYDDENIKRYKCIFSMMIKVRINIWWFSSKAILIKFSIACLNLPFPNNVIIFLQSRSFFFVHAHIFSMWADGKNEIRKGEREHIDRRNTKFISLIF